MNYVKELLVRYISFNSFKKASIYDRLRCQPLFSGTNAIIEHLDEVNKESKFMAEQSIEPSINVDLYKINLIDELMISFFRDCIQKVHDKYDDGDKSVGVGIIVSRGLISTVNIEIADGKNVNEMIKDEIGRFADLCISYITNFDSENIGATKTAFIEISQTYYKIMEALYHIASIKNRSDKYFWTMIRVYTHLMLVNVDRPEQNKVITRDTLYNIGT